MQEDEYPEIEVDVERSAHLIYQDKLKKQVENFLDRGYSPDAIKKQLVTNGISYPLAEYLVESSKPKKKLAPIAMIITLLAVIASFVLVTEPQIVGYVINIGGEIMPEENITISNITEPIISPENITNATVPETILPEENITKPAPLLADKGEQEITASCDPDPINCYNVGTCGAGAPPPENEVFSDDGGATCHLNDPTCLNADCKSGGEEGPCTGTEVCCGYTEVWNSGTSRYDWIFDSNGGCEDNVTDSSHLGTITINEGKNVTFWNSTISTNGDFTINGNLTIDGSDTADRTNIVVGGSFTVSSGGFKNGQSIFYTNNPGSSLNLNMTGNIKNLQINVSGGDYINNELNIESGAAITSNWGGISAEFLNVRGHLNSVIKGYNNSLSSMITTVYSGGDLVTGDSTSTSQFDAFITYENGNYTNGGGPIEFYSNVDIDGNLSIANSPIKILSGSADLDLNASGGDSRGRPTNVEITAISSTSKIKLTEPLNITGKLNITKGWLNTNNQPVQIGGDLEITGGIFNATGENINHIFKTLNVTSNGEINMTSGTTTITGENAAGYAVDIDGKLDAGTGTLKIITGSDTFADLYSTTNDLYNLEIATGSGNSVTSSSGSPINTTKNITVTSGELWTNNVETSIGDSLVVEGTFVTGASYIEIGKHLIAGSGTLTAGTSNNINMTGTGTLNVTTSCETFYYLTLANPSQTTTLEGCAKTIKELYLESGTVSGGTLIIDKNSDGLTKDSATSFEDNTIKIESNTLTLEGASTSYPYSKIWISDYGGATPTVTLGGNVHINKSSTSALKIDSGGTLDTSGYTINVSNGAGTAGTQIQGTFTGSTGKHYFDYINVSGGNFNADGEVTVYENTTIENSGSIDTSSTFTGGNLIVTGGIFNATGSNADHTFSSINVTSGGEINMTSGTTTITGENAAGYAVDIDGKLDAGTGTLNITTTTDTQIDITSTTNNIYNLLIDNGDVTKKVENVDPVTIDGNITISHGTLKLQADDIVTVLDSILVANPTVVNSELELWGGLGSELKVSKHVNISSGTINSGGTLNMTGTGSLIARNSCQAVGGSLYLANPSQTTTIKGCASVYDALHISSGTVSDGTLVIEDSSVTFTKNSQAKFDGTTLKIQQETLTLPSASVNYPYSRIWLSDGRGTTPTVTLGGNVHINKSSTSALKINSGGTLDTSGYTINVSNGAGTAGTQIQGTFTGSTGDHYFDYINIDSGDLNLGGGAVKVYENITFRNSGKAHRVDFGDGITNISYVGGSDFAIYNLDIPNIPVDDSNFLNASTYVNISELGDGTATLNLSYSQSFVDTYGLTESDFKLFRYPVGGSQWSVVSDSGVDTNSNVINGTLTTFSTIGGGQGQSCIGISLLPGQSTVSFGTIDRDVASSTTDGTPPPLNISADAGCVTVNVTIYGTEIWDGTGGGMPSAKFRAKCRDINSTDTCPTGSETSYVNIPLSGTNQKLIKDLIGGKSANIDFELTPPADEGAGSKSSTITLIAWDTSL